jgi:hypothetical protein
MIRTLMPGALKDSLAALAEAYGATFPLPADVAMVRQAERQEVSRELDALSKAARTLASRLGGNQPSSGEAINAQMRQLTQAYKLTT